MDLNETRERIIYQKEGPIAKITLNWPEKANAQDQKLAEEVDAALLDADRDYDIKVLVLKANGKGFCSGHAIGNNAVDYPAFVENAMVTGHPWKAQSDLFVKPTLNLWEFSKPTIAQVHGYCVGGGTHMGLTTDIVIASEDAYFSYPPLQGFGMPSGECSIEPWVFMNWRRAAYYLFTAEVIDAKKALEVGLVNEVVKREDLDARVDAIARHIAQAPLTTLMLTKANLQRAWELMGMRAHWQISNDLVALASISDDSLRAGPSPALILSDSVRMAFGEVHVRSQRVAAVLRGAGLRPGDGVALVLPNRPELVEITWGCQLSGLYYTAVNTHFTPDEVAYVIDDSDAKAVFVDASMSDLAAHLRSANAAVDVHIAVGGELPGWQSYDDAMAAAGDAPPVLDGSEMLYSSGTTGRPKAVRRALPTDGNGSWAQSVLELTLIHKYGMSPANVYLSPAPMYHAAGVNYTMAVNRVGAAAIIMPKFDAEAVLRLIETHRVTHAQFVPTMFVRMLKLPKAVREKYDVSSLRCVIHAAAPCPVDVKDQMMKWFGPIVHEYYGGTEGFAGTTIGPEEWLAHPGSVGIPMAPVHVVGEDGQELSVGESGELYLEGGPDF